MKTKGISSIRQVLAPLQVIFVLLMIVFPAVAAENSHDRSMVQSEEGKTEIGMNSESAPQDTYKAGQHQTLECSRCHKENTGDHSQPVESVIEDSVRLCQGCHPVDHIHPVGLVIQPEMVNDENFSLPLGKGVRDGQIICPTCHAIHQYENNPYLLRGFSGTYTSVRNSLCYSCHSDHFSGKSPHADGTSNCGFCHVARPSKNDSRPLVPDLFLQAACTSCHPNSTPLHFAGVNPFEDRIIRQQAVQSGILLKDGQETCITCHQHHVKENIKYHLRRDYLSLCEDSRSLNPHWNDYLCMSCHREEPVKGNAALRENDDKNKVCNRCHRTEYARADIHPVDIVPSQHIRVPEDMPLQEKKLTCETCHDSLLQIGKHQQGKSRKTNPNFLRRKIVSRNSFCFLCHIEETYKLLNPHKQLNEKGEVQEEACLFCHAAIPDIHFIGPEKVSFIVYNPDEYCIGCHHGFNVNHPAGFNHLVKPSNKIMAAIRTSVQRIRVELPLYKGKIVCATCHNPHQAGVIKIDAAASGANRENKLRLKPGRIQCTGCHWDK